MKWHPLRASAGILSGIWILLHAGCISKTPVTEPDSGYDWNKLADSTDWPVKGSFQLLTIQDTFWVLHRDGNWFSLDGKDWTRSVLPNVIGDPYYLSYVFFQNKLFGLGHFEGTAEEHHLRSTIYISSDRLRWDSVPNTNLPKRYFYHPFVFHDKIWIMGGEQDETIFADVLNSTDGIHWQIMKDKLPFGPVINSRFIIFRDSVWMFNQDVWSSGDGYEWKQKKETLFPDDDILGYAALDFDHKMWLIGSYGKYDSDHQVAFSEDGVHWTGQHAPWIPRDGVEASRANNKIIVTGGKYGGTPDHPEFTMNKEIWAMTHTQNTTPPQAQHSGKK
jgi:hypothetical protein